MPGRVRSGHIAGLNFSNLVLLARNARELQDFAGLFHQAIDSSTADGRCFLAMIAPKGASSWVSRITHGEGPDRPIRERLTDPDGAKP